MAAAIPPQIYNINVIPAQVDEVDDGNEDGAHDKAEYANAEGKHDYEAEDDDIPQGSDDEYNDEEDGDAYPDDYILDNNVIPEEQALEDVPVRTRSGRIIRRTQNLPDYNINMLSALDDEDTITVKDDEIAYMGVMLIHVPHTDRKSVVYT